MKKYTLIVLLCLLLIFTSCSCADNNDLNATQYDKSKSHAKANELSTDKVSHLEALPLSSDSVKSISKSDLDILFNKSYGELKSISCDHVNISIGRPFKYALDYPLITINHDESYYFLNSDDDSPVSLISFTSNYEIDNLLALQINSKMTLEEISKLDENYQIQTYWCSYGCDYHNYIKIQDENYTYYITAYSENQSIIDIYIEKNNANDIAEQYNSLLDLIQTYSDYSGYPIYYNEGDINGDEYLDLMITFKVDQPSFEHLKTPIDEDRISLFLFGDKNDYKKYGEVLGLITSNGGNYGIPLVDITIDNGEIIISQYGGSIWRWHTFSIYTYDKSNQQIYLNFLEDCSYHNDCPIEDTLQTTLSTYTDKYTILDGYPLFDGDRYEKEVVKIDNSRFSYPKYEESDDPTDQFIKELIDKHRIELVDKIIAQNIEGNFEIDTYTQIANEKVISMELYVKGQYNDPETNYNSQSFYYDDIYINMDLVHLKEINIADFFTVDEISQSLYNSYKKSASQNLYKTVTKNDIYEIVESSINGFDNHDNRFDYYFNDMSVNLILYLEYSDEDTLHSVESTLIRKDDFIVQSDFYKEWFCDEFQH